MSVGRLYAAHMSPPVRTVLLTIKALDIRVDEIKTNIQSGEPLKSDYIKNHPQHTVPFYIDQDGSKIGDSHAISAYLVSKYGKNDELYPRDLSKRAIVDQRLHFDSQCLFPYAKGLANGFIKDNWKSIPEDFPPIINKNYDLLNLFLNSDQWIAGNSVTIADFSTLTTVTALDMFVPVTKEYPNLMAWLKNCENWPYYSAHSVGFAKIYNFFKKSGFIKE